MQKVKYNWAMPCQSSQAIKYVAAKEKLAAYLFVQNEKWQNQIWVYAQYPDTKSKISLRKAIVEITIVGDWREHHSLKTRNICQKDDMNHCIAENKKKMHSNESQVVWFTQQGNQILNE